MTFELRAAETGDGAMLTCLLCGADTPAPASLPTDADLLGYDVLCGKCGPQVANSPWLQGWLARQAKKRGPTVKIQKRSSSPGTSEKSQP